MSFKKIQNPKGTRDVLPEERKYWQAIDSAMNEVAGLYGFERLEIPIFEETALFQRGVGESTDIVEKEMYTFLDKGESSITLRPEFTAGVIRAYIQNGMASRTKPVKLWSTGPIFRYERPQAGRYRQFTQFNAEALGEIDPVLDFEIMSMAWRFYDTLGFKNLSFQLNSIGCPVCRPNYFDQLTGYYKKHQSEVCEDCQTRLYKNPLRLLDCKKDSCQPIIQSAPVVVDVLCDECKDHFSSLQKYLDNTNRTYTINHHLVRGLDYYTKTVFEIWAEGIGAQNAICGGGRYDGLVELLGGAPTPAVGFASGLERIVLTMQQQEINVSDIKTPMIYLLVPDQNAVQTAVILLQTLRHEGISCVMGMGGRSFKAQMREANRRGVNFTFIFGEDELAKNQVMVKNMTESTQETVSLDKCVDYIRSRG